jgi:hypothetical protein
MTQTLHATHLPSTHVGNPRMLQYRLVHSVSHVSQVASASEEQQEVRAASAGLGLAILAGFCGVPELAATQEIIQNVPLLLKAGAAWIRCLFYSHLSHLTLHERCRCASSCGILCQP